MEITEKEALMAWIEHCSAKTQEKELKTLVNIEGSTLDADTFV